MSTQALMAAAGGQQKNIATMPKDRQFPAMLEQFKGEIVWVLLCYLNADRMARIAFICFC
jgi:hypothetical protein